MYRLLLATALSLSTQALFAPLVLAAAPSEFQISHQNFIRSDQTYFGSDMNLDQISTIGFDLSYERSKSGKVTAAHVKPFYSFQEEEPYVNLSELYREYSIGSANFTLGRKKQRWSYADEQWNLGLWQPQFKWDRMRQEQQGLTGFFMDKKLSGNKQIRVFASPLFIPDDMVGFREENGKLISKNPWFKPPPNRANVFEVDNDIYAYLERPKTADVVFNPNLAVRIENDINESNSIAVAYAYKPINQVLNSFAYNYLVADEFDSGIELHLKPWVGYHHLLTTEHHFSSRYLTNNLSATYEKPTRLLENQDLVYQQIKEAVILSWLSSYAIAGEGDSAFRIFGGYMRQFGGYSEDGGDVFDDGTQFEIRQRYLSVIRAGLSYPIWHKTRRIRNNIEVNYDTIINGGTVLSEVEYAFSDHLFVTGNVDLIGVFEANEGTAKMNYINTYRANDRVQLRLSYVY